VRIGTILPAGGAALTALIIAFASGWKLTLVALCFVPLLLLNGLFQGQKHAQHQDDNKEGSLSEQGGQVRTTSDSLNLVNDDISVCNTSDGQYSNDCLVAKRKSFHRTLRKGLHRRYQVGTIDRSIFVSIAMIELENKCLVCISWRSARPSPTPSFTSCKGRISSTGGNWSLVVKWNSIRCIGK
jgi:hypothetical protein